MKKLLIILFSSVVITANSQTDETKAARIDSIFSVFTKKNMFSGSVLIAKKGKVLLSKGYGMANYSYDVPNRPDTKFKLASVSKQFTAMAILILEEKGKLSTEDKLSKYIKDYPNGDKISLYNLITHTSGIKEVTSLPFFDSISSQPHTLLQMISYTKDLPLDFEPGSKHQYSNSGYVLLTYIIEQVSGKSYGEFMQEAIFKPLGMKNSGLYNNSEVMKNFAMGYHSDENVLENVEFVHMSIPSGAGALYSTVEDLFLWDQALYTEKLVKKVSLVKMITPFKDGYACGLKIDNYNGHKWINHSGGIQGFATITNRFPDDELYITILKNVDNWNIFPANKVCRAIMFGDKYELPQERKIAAVDPKIFQKLTGDYELMPGFVMSITTEAGKIYAQATNQPRLEIYPESEYKYFLKVVDAQLEFTKDAKGNVTTLTLFQGGAKMPGNRVKKDLLDVGLKKGESTKK